MKAQNNRLRDLLMLGSQHKNRHQSDAPYGLPKQRSHSTASKMLRKEILLQKKLSKIYCSFNIQNQISKEQMSMKKNKFEERMRRK